MKIYKYRDLSQADEPGFGRLARVVRSRAFWCARPDSLNDSEEFAWKCDFTVSPDTVDLLADLLVRLKGRSRELARQLALDAIRDDRLRVLAEPVIEDLIRQSRDGIGVVCFGTSPDNDTLWKRYGGDGAGACVELDVPDALLGSQLHRVIYSDGRRIHVDDFLRSRFDLSHGAVVYASLLSKTTFWAPEEEVRFLSKRQRIEVVVDRSEVTRVIVGPKLEPATTERVREIAGAIPVVAKAPYVPA